jgi:hypothetical protein
MPFLAAPVLGAIIGGGASIATGLLGRSSQNRANDIAQQGVNQQNQISQQQLAFARDQFNRGVPLLDRGSEGLNAPINYHRDILNGGGRQSLAGPMADIARGYQQGRQNTAMFAPRGSTASAYANYGRQMSGDMARLRSDQMGNSAGELGKLYSTLLGTGQSLMTGGQGGLAAAGSTALGGAQLALGNRQISNQNSLAAGQGLGSLLGILLGPGGLLSSRTSGGSSGSGSPFLGW